MLYQTSGESQAGSPFFSNTTIDVKLPSNVGGSVQIERTTGTGAAGTVAAGGQTLSLSMPLIVLAIVVVLAVIVLRR